MLFKLFTNATGGRQVLQPTKLIDSRISTKAVVMAITLALWLSACSSKPTEHESQENGVTTPLVVDESISKESLIKGNDATEGTPQSKREPAINLYLQQQADNPIIVAANVLKDYQQAISLMEEKKWPQAQALFDQVILAQPQLSGSYVNKAIIVKQEGKLLAAQVLLNKAIAANSLNLYAHHLQGKVYRLQGKFEQAEQSYLAALAIWPDFAEAHASMAILLELYRGRLLEAHGYYCSYLLLNSDDEEVKRWLAGLEIKIKRAGLEIPKAVPTLVEAQIAEASVELNSDDEQSIDNKTAPPSEEPNHE
ncbi:tetratricopeptide repeat protein [Colwellia psychrerythraea]|uniref:Tetratricopeptide repeat-containing protein n=1 Tax=Colwellia psychrerythraea TaxID=28229 RepID=A0A099KZE2_COLPS|nr:tetratricopeptide repeat protein [Colwellia psychrerythraea]KGJ95008.1 Tetratricopeptide repeat-containing protein [Colwellia psychrerythraea]